MDFLSLILLSFFMCSSLLCGRATVRNDDQIWHLAYWHFCKCLVGCRYSESTGNNSLLCTLSNTAKNGNLQQDFKWSQMLDLTIVQVDDLEEPVRTYEDVYNKTKSMKQATSPIQLFQALQSRTMRENLSIPSALWKEMESELRTNFMKQRDMIRKKREQKDQQTKDQARKSSFRQDPLSAQYANKTSMDLVANACSWLTLYDSDEETDDDIVTQVFHTTTLEHRAMPYAGASLNNDSWWL